MAYREEKHAGTTTQRVAKNSLAPMALNLFNRVIDFAFAALMLRILQPENAGNFYFAVVIVGWVEIFTNFGLNTFLTREVSRDRSGANRFFANTSILRLDSGRHRAAGVDHRAADRQRAVPVDAGNGDHDRAAGAGADSQQPQSTGMTAMFYAYEKAEYPAALGVVTVLLKVFFGVPALLAGWGIIGLGLVSLLVNCITFVVLYHLAAPLDHQAALRE